VHDDAPVTAASFRQHSSLCSSTMALQMDAQQNMLKTLEVMRRMDDPHLTSVRSTHKLAEPSLQTMCPAGPCQIPASATGMPRLLACQV
jgi:hypothetical protein